MSAAEVGNNTLKNSDTDELLRQIAYARRHYDGVKLDEEMRRIRALAGKLAQDNFKEIQACQNNPTPDCINKIKAEYKDVNFAGLQDAYREYQGTHTILNGYAYRNNSVVSCADSGFADCIVRKDGERVMQEGAYAAIGGVRAGRNQVTVPTNKPSTNVGNQASKGSKDLNVGNNNINYEKSLHDKINDKLPIKISGKFKPQEEKDAIRFAQQQGGGSFKFSDNKNQQGIEGVFVGKTGVEYPVSLKRLTTTNTKKVQTKIAENAQQIYRAENLPKGNPHKLPSGTLEKTTIHVRLTNITKEQMISDLNSYPINGISTRFDKIILDTNNGRIVINRGKISEVK